MIQLKERKEMDEAFKKAQKPWAKFLQKVERTRLEYHTACKQERTAQNQERNASGDSSLSPDQVSGDKVRTILFYCMAWTCVLASAVSLDYLTMKFDITHAKPSN